jgi:hypothetical protein
MNDKRRLRLFFELNLPNKDVLELIWKYCDKYTRHILSNLQKRISNLI